MKHETQSVLSWRRHLILWWVELRSPPWVCTAAAHAVLTGYMLGFGDQSMVALGAVSAMAFIVAQFGLWFAVGEREARRLGGGKDSRE